MGDNSLGNLAGGLVAIAGATMLLGWTQRMTQGWQQQGFIKPRQYVRPQPARKPPVQRKKVERKAPVELRSGRVPTPRVMPVARTPMYRSPWARDPERRI